MFQRGQMGEKRGRQKNSQRREKLKSREIQRRERKTERMIDKNNLSRHRPKWQPAVK